LDALGGNGTLTRIVRASRPPAKIPFIVTSDVSARMIESALALGLPAVRQPLQNLIWFDDCTFDAVIVAYGSHHIPLEQRATAVAEAYRVLKPNGRIVLQDFEVGCPTTRWYSEVLDKYTLTGHKFEYFSRHQFHDLLVGNLFTDVEIMDVYDPFVVYAKDARDAKRRLLEYVFTLFALERLLPENGTFGEQFWDQLETVVRATSTFHSAELPIDVPCVNEFTVAADADRFRAEIPRVCLVATGKRPEVSRAASDRR
jgi:SAM-dependent methyltransferase